MDKLYEENSKKDCHLPNQAWLNISISNPHPKVFFVVVYTLVNGFMYILSNVKVNKWSIMSKKCILYISKLRLEG